MIEFKEAIAVYRYADMSWTLVRSSFYGLKG